MKPSSKIYIVQNHVSKSGMTRRLAIYAKARGEHLCNITDLVGELLGWHVNDNGLKVVGCGMDMHFHTASCLSRALFDKRRVKTFKGNGGSCLDWQTL